MKSSRAPQGRVSFTPTNIRLSVITFLIACLLSTGTFAQSHGDHTVARSAGFSGTGANINVTYHKAFWRINPDSSVKYIKGYVQTNFITTDNNVTAISFDLNAVLTVDSVLYHGTRITTTRTGNIIQVQLGTSLPINHYDSLRIYYQGIPPGVIGSAQGYQRGNSSTAGSYIITLSESYEDRDWWPCKADMQDKIDSMDIVVSTPWDPATTDTFWAASNGRLVDSSIIGNNRFFTWQSRYPIASYLVSVAVARYNRYHRPPVALNNGQVPVVYYLLAGKSEPTYTNILASMDKINAVLQAFSNSFGDYPFKLEKHGFYDGLMGAGGMEHQTFSGINSVALQNQRTLAHELGHQWFGDNVSFATWNDLWLAEGFASYCEILGAELLPAAIGQNYVQIRNNTRVTALNQDVSPWVPNSNIVSSNALWNSTYGSAVYDRGAMVVSMLRAICGDAKFFQALKNYQSAMAGKAANTDTLKRYFNDVLGKDIGVFFNDYVGGSGGAVQAIGGIGHPNYTINWSPAGTNKLLVQVAFQAQSAGSNVTYFHGPVVLRVRGAVSMQDTTIKFFDWGPGLISYAGNGITEPVPGAPLIYQLSFAPQTVTYDELYETLSTGITIRSVALPVSILDFTGQKTVSGNVLSLRLAATVSRVELMSSSNGTDFVRVGDMLLTGNSRDVTYQFTDPNSSSVIYYRATIYEDTNMRYSDIVKIQSAGGKKLQLLPNPTKGQLQVLFDNQEQVLSHINIINAAGQRMAVFKTSSGIINANVGHYADGVYFVQLLQNNVVVQTEKLIIKK